MLAISEFSAAARLGLKGVLCDIDDTLSTDGRLTARAYGAMERLRARGLLVVPVTGRRAGWSDHIARMWQVDAVVGETGAFYFRYDDKARRMHRRYHQPPDVLAANRVKLRAVGARILAAVPGAAISADQAYREADIAIDFCEDVAALERSDIDRIVAIMHDEGLTAKVSSIHVNGWIGDYDKLTMTRHLFTEQFATDLDEAKERFVFVGDSPNDQPMFEYFPHAVGVANLMRFADQLTTPPAYITAGEAGDGFAELVDLLLNPDE